MPETIDLTILGIDNEEDARLLDKSLAKVPDLLEHKVEFSNQRALIATESRSAIQVAISQINRLGYEVKSEQVQLPVEGMSCAACASSVENILGRQSGILEANVNFANASVQLHYLPNLTQPETFRQALQKIGFDLRLEEDNIEQDKSLEEVQKEQTQSLKIKTLLAALFTLPVMLLGMVFTDFPYANYLTLVFTSIVLFSFGKHFFVNALRQVRHGYANMDSLVALSTGVAYLFSLINTIYPDYLTERGLEAHVYYEAAAVIITFILLGRWMESRAKSQTTQALRQLVGLQVKTVTRINEQGEAEEINIAQVQVNNYIRVKSGEKIPVDGIVVEGSSLVDESLISGEPLPIEKEGGSKVFAGTLNQQGSFVLRAERVGKSTLLAQIIERVKQAQGSKTKVQQLADQVAAIFVPAVMIIALLSFVIWLLFGGENAFTHAVLALVTVLVIACPCALGLATPTAIMVAVGKAANLGILVKDAESLEVVPKINTLILDKTGTITKGKPSLNAMYWLEDDVALLSILYQMERQASHPLGEAIVRYLEKEGLIDIELSDFETLGGKGLKATYQGQTYWVGNQRLMENESINVPHTIQQKAEESKLNGSSLVYFAQDQEVKGLITLRDEPKLSSASAIHDLQVQGIEVHMLTGDNQASAQRIAEMMNITHYQADMLPQDKEDYIKALQAQGKKVAMVGDGINDSPALARADMSIAMGKGADIAIEVAKLTIISSDLTKISEAITLSKQTVNTIHQNLFWAFFYNIIGIPIAAGLLYPFFGFLLNPMLAGAAMAFSSVSVVSNSLRLKYTK